MGLHKLMIMGNFNPRLREGGDHIPFSSSACGKIISIHASAKEATHANPYIIGEILISIHASAKEATCLVWKLL